MKNLYALALAVFFLSNGSAHAVLIDKVVATVNSDVILQSDVERFQPTLKLRTQTDPILGLSKDLKDAASLSKAKITDFLIIEQLILQNFKITDTEVDQDIAAVLRAQNADLSSAEAYLRSEGISMTEYRELMRRGASKRALYEREIRSRVHISDEDVKNEYYNNALKNSATPLEYSLQVIRITLANYKSQKAAQEAADQALRSIRQGEPFSDVAKRVSDDRDSAEAGGELGYLHSESLSQPLHTAAKRLSIGAVSEPIKTDDAYLIVKLVNVRAAEDQRFADEKERIRARLGEEASVKQLYIWAERAKNNAYVHINP